MFGLMGELFEVNLYGDLLGLLEEDLDGLFEGDFDGDLVGLLLEMETSVFPLVANCWAPRRRFRGEGGDFDGDLLGRPFDGDLLGLFEGDLEGYLDGLLLREIWVNYLMASFWGSSRET
jgi:hypothetical protein